MLIEKRYINIPIIFCFNGHFFQWEDINILLYFMNENSKISKIKLVTNEDTYSISSFEEYLKLQNIEYEVLKELHLYSNTPSVQIEMNIQSVSVSLVIDWENKREVKIPEFLDSFMNKGNIDEPWFCINNNYYLQSPTDSPDIKSLFR